MGEMFESVCPRRCSFLYPVIILLSLNPILYMTHSSSIGIMICNTLLCGVISVGLFLDQIFAEHYYYMD